MNTRILSLLLAAVATLSAAASAQTWTVHQPPGDPSPTTGRCNVIPFGSYWLGGEARYQALVPASSFSGKPGKILDIAFVPCASTVRAITATRIEIRFAPTTKTALDRTFANNLSGGATLVYAGTTYRYTPEAWSPIALTAPFNHDGTSGLVVEVRYRGGTGPGGYHGFKRSAACGVDRIWAWGAQAFGKSVSDGGDGCGLKMRFTLKKRTPSPRCDWNGFPVISLARSGTYDAGYTVVLDPARGQQTTLAATPAGYFANWVEMAADNRDVLVSLGASDFKSGLLVNVAPDGVRTTIATVAGDYVSAMELDHDDTWVMAGTRNLLALSNATRTVTTLSTPGLTGLMNNLLIDRSPGSAPYVIGVYQTSSLTWTPKLVGADRTGVLSTIAAGVGDPLLRLSDVEMDPVTETYLVTDFLKWEVSRVSKAGAITSLASVPGANGVKVNPDGTAWVLGIRFTPARTNLLYRIDGRGTVLTIVPIASSSSYAVTGIETYASRTLRLDGSGTIGTSLAVHVQTCHPTRSYMLAASFSRGPGLPMPNGQVLGLGYDPLFLISAFGIAPSVFRGFRGFTDSDGRAEAAIALPALPSLRGAAFFVAGLVLDGARVVTVTNTESFRVR